MAQAIIYRDKYEENVKKLTKEYEGKKSAICKKYGMKPANYEMVAEIVTNEEFKRNIKDLARGGAALVDEPQMVQF